MAHDLVNFGSKPIELTLGYVPLKYAAAVSTGDVGSGLQAESNTQLVEGQTPCPTGHW